MKKRVRITGITITVFSIFLIAVAPHLFRKPMPTKTNTIIASNDKLEKLPSVEPAPMDLKNSIARNQPADPGIALTTQSKTIPETISTGNTSKYKPEGRNLIPNEKIQPNTGINSKTTQNYLPVDAFKLNNPKLKEKTPHNTGETSETGNKPSPWAINVLVTNAGVDAGMSYRLLQFQLINETDMDFIVATKQAGIGLTKYITGNLGLGIVGTVSYWTGNKNLGIHAKYSL
jgi:hypothetical protein